MTSSDPLCRWENVPEGQPPVQHSTNLSCMGERTDICPQWRRDNCFSSTDNPNGVLKKHLKESRTVRNKILWSDGAKIELFGLHFKHFSSDAWQRQHDAMGEFFSSWDKETGLG